MQNNYGIIDNRSTNASAESFNAKVKVFKSQEVSEIFYSLF
jgi:hypothetical protein